MATQEYSVLVWGDTAGGFTAALVGQVEPAAATASTQDEALRQLKELLDGRAENGNRDVDPDFTEAALVEVKVEVRPQYRMGERMISCPETLWLRVPCVTGNQASGLRLCVVPHLQVQFSFQDTADLKSLVAHYVKDALQGLTSPQLAACLPPREAHLEKIVIRIAADQARRLPPADRPELKVLFTVADALLHNLGRKRPASVAYGREMLAETLSQKLGTEKASVLLVGESGVGKSTLLLDAAKRLARSDRAKAGSTEGDENAGQELRTYRFWRGSGGRLIAGMRYLGEWEERCEEFA